MESNKVPVTTATSRTVRSTAMEHAEFVTQSTAIIATASPPVLNALRLRVWHAWTLQLAKDVREICASFALVFENATIARR